MFALKSVPAVPVTQVVLAFGTLVLDSMIVICADFMLMYP